MELVADPSPDWPPSNTLYTLPVDVEFEDPNNPELVMLTVCAGSVAVSGFVSEIFSDGFESGDTGGWKIGDAPVAPDSPAAKSSIR